MAIRKTDGYVTHTDAGDWKYSNTGGADRGDVTILDAESDAYIRVAKTDAPKPGRQVLIDGTEQDGPIIEFDTVDALLAGAPEADGERPWIVWAGVSPMSLRECLIVWNKPIVLLDKNKVVLDGDSPFSIVTVVGRLMVVVLDEPTAIDASEYLSITVRAGAVGFYREMQEDEGDGEEEAQPEDQCPPVEEEPPEGGEDPPPDPPPADESTPEEEPSPILDDTIFCNMCNPAAQCGTLRGSTAAFAVNNEAVFAATCTYAFELVEAKVCAGMQRATVWMVAMDLFAATIPLETFPISRLLNYDVDKVGSYSYGDGVFPAVLLHGSGDVKEAICCDTQVVIQIVGTAGPEIVIDEVFWSGNQAGFPGQPIFYSHCSNICHTGGHTGEPGAAPSPHADCYVAEDIIKPQQRVLPVEFFQSEMLHIFDLPPLTQISHTLEIMTTCYTGVFNVIKEPPTPLNVVFPTWISTDNIEIPGFAEAAWISLILPVTNVTQFVTSCERAGLTLHTGDVFKGTWPVVTHLYETSKDVVVSLLMTSLPVITAINKQSVNLITHFESTILAVMTHAEITGVQYFVYDVSVCDVTRAVFIEHNTTALDLVTVATGTFFVMTGSPVTEMFHALSFPNIILPITALKGTETIYNIVGVSEISFPQGGIAQVEVGKFGSTNVQLITGFQSVTASVLTAGVAVTDVNMQNINIVTALRTTSVIVFDDEARTGEHWVNQIKYSEVVGSVTASSAYFYGAESDGFYITTVGSGYYSGVNTVLVQTGLVTAPGPVVITAINGTRIAVCSGTNQVTISIITWIGTGAGSSISFNAVTGVSIGYTSCNVITHLGVSQLNLMERVYDMNWDYVQAALTVSLQVPPVYDATVVMGAFSQLTPVITHVGTVAALTKLILPEQTLASNFVVPVLSSPTQIWAFTEAPVFDTVTLPTGSVERTIKFVTDLEYATGAAVSMPVITHIPGESKTFAMNPGVTSVEVVQSILTGVRVEITDIDIWSDSFDISIYLTELSCVVNPITEVIDILKDPQTYTVTYVHDPQKELISYVNNPALINLTAVTAINTAVISVVTMCYAGNLPYVSDKTTTSFQIVSPADPTTINLVVSVALTNLDVLTTLNITTVTLVKSCAGLTTTIGALITDIVGDPIPLLTPDNSFPTWAIILTHDASGGCDTPFKFIMHDGEPLKYVKAITNQGDCCDGDIFECQTSTGDHPAEVGCSSIVLLSPIPVIKEASENAEKCPCYDCSEEPPCVDGKNDVDAKPFGVDPEPCVIRVHRLNRRWCKRCR